MTWPLRSSRQKNTNITTITTMTITIIIMITMNTSMSTTMIMTTNMNIIMTTTTARTAPAAATSKSFSEAAIKAALEELDSGDFGMILRAKGIVAGEDGNWIHFDYVPGEADVRNGGADVTGKLCVIGSKVDKDAVKVLFGL